MHASCAAQRSVSFFGGTVVTRRVARQSLRSMATPCVAGAKQTVLVTGAAGRTGRLVYEALLSRPEQFSARGLVRTAESKAALGNGDNLFVGDVSSNSSALEEALRGCDALIILTSATPKMVAPPKPGERPEFVYPAGGLPEQVDWHGQKAQVDAARALGVKNVVVVGSRGGTDPNNMLNRIGGEGTNILVWKRKSEKYLVDSGLDYTIIRAGGLLDKPGRVRQLVIGSDDADLGFRAVPRADVAEMAIQALLCKEASGCSLDLVSKEEGDGAPTADFAALFATAKRGM